MASLANPDCFIYGLYVEIIWHAVYREKYDFVCVAMHGNRPACVSASYSIRDVAGG